MKLLDKNGQSNDWNFFTTIFFVKGQFRYEWVVPNGGGDVEAAVEVREAAIGGEAAAAAEEAACATTSIVADQMGCKL